MTRLKRIRSLLMLSGLVCHGLATAQGSATFSLRVVTENLAPYNMVERGEITGLSTEIVQAVLNEVGVSPRIEVLPWARAYDVALHSDNVLIYSIARTPQREHLFKWVGAIAPTQWFLFSLAERPIVLNSLEDAKRYQVATVNQDVGEQYLLAHGFQLGKQLQSSSTYELNYQKLKVDHVELWISNELNAVSLMQKNGDDANSMVRSLALPELSSRDGLYMAFSLGTPDEVVARYQSALRKIRNGGIYDAIVKKWLGESANSVLK